MQEHKKPDAEKIGLGMRNAAMCLSLAALALMLAYASRGEDRTALGLAVASLMGALVALWQGREVGKLRAAQPTRGVFHVDERAVSPVIAVILMVAITVVLAATVFVLVADIGTREIPPSIGFTVDTTEDTLTVTSVSVNGLTWGDIVVEGCDKPGNETIVDAGDSLTNCTGNVKVVHTPSNTLIYSAKFD